MATDLNISSNHKKEYLHLEDELKWTKSGRLTFANSDLNVNAQMRTEIDPRSIQMSVNTFLKRTERLYLLWTMIFLLFSKLYFFYIPGGCCQILLKSGTKTEKKNLTYDSRFWLGTGGRRSLLSSFYYLSKKRRQLLILLFSSSKSFRHFVKILLSIIISLRF